MLRFDPQEARRAAQCSAAGILGLALLTLIAFRLHLNFAAASSCYLLLVILLSLSGDMFSSALVSVAAVGCLDYYFVEPVLSFRIEKSVNVLALASFLVTGLIIARLVAKVRAKAATSQVHHERLQQLYELAQKLLALQPDVAVGKDFLELFIGVFGIEAACLYDAVGGELQFAGHPRALLEEKTGEAFARGKDRDDPVNRIHARCIRIAGSVTGAIGFEGLDDPQTAGPLGALGAAHLERTHSFRKASRAAASAHTESYRSAILDALAHEFKTPLSTILTAAGALREAGTLGPHHREMAETVESEAARLSRLTMRLIRTARLEQEEVRPWMELMDLASVIEETVEPYARMSAERSICVVKECNSSDVQADPELIRLLVGQLLDNACKYSTPGSPVTLRVSRQGDQLALRVFSSGNPIDASEKPKIFDRFYRGAGGQRRAPGSGLGLFVARKIALAHGGRLELEDDDPADGTVFCLSLPVPEPERRSERNDIATAV
ncbi:MAG TPA: ATP-binding protein [Bryobacteraceae bacterium]|nr:ATP-binding protein [Bryobacteraceae bacterium]